MKTRVKVVSFSVLHDAISVRLLCESASGLTNEPRDERRKVSLGDLLFEAKIRSINIQREGVSILLRTKRSRYIVGKLYDLMEKESIEFSVTENLAGRLSNLLFRVSRKTGESEEDLLFRLTTFRDKDGREIHGKRLINDLSENQKFVVLKKLNSMLQREDGQCLVS